MAGTTAFFNPETPFDGGELNGWEVTSVSDTTSRQRAQALGSGGDEIASRTSGEKEELSVEYVCTAADAAIPGVGIVAAAAGTSVLPWHIDGVAVRWTQNDFVRMTLTMHRHGTTSHTVGSCRTYASPLGTVGVLFGCPATPAGFTIPQGAGVRSCSLNIALHHVDEPNGTGDFLAGDNYDGHATAEVELCDTGTITAASGWTLMQDADSKGNTVAESKTATAEIHIAHASTAATLSFAA